MSMFKPINEKTPAEYIKMIEDPKRREDMEKLHQFIQKTVPKLKPHIQVGMMGYGSFHYKSASGREGDWAIIGLASQKNYISVYACASDPKTGMYTAEKYKKELGKVSVGRSCIRFKKLEDVDLKVLATVIKESEELMNKD